MIERKEVEALLAYVEMRMASDKVELPPSVSDGTLAALCRAWLALEDAPVVEVRDASFSDGHRVGKLIGQRVRIVGEVRDHEQEKNNE